MCVCVCGGGGGGGGGGGLRVLVSGHDHQDQQQQNKEGSAHGQETGECLCLNIREYVAFVQNVQGFASQKE